MEGRQCKSNNGVHSNAPLLRRNSHTMYCPPLGSCALKFCPPPSSLSYSLFFLIVAHFFNLNWVVLQSLLQCEADLAEGQCQWALEVVFKFLWAWKWRELSRSNCLIPPLLCGDPVSWGTTWEVWVEAGVKWKRSQHGFTSVPGG